MNFSNKTKIAIAIISGLSISHLAFAGDAPYYTLKEIGSIPTGANFGAIPTAMSDDGKIFATQAMKAAILPSIDLGLPFTFNKDCQYDRDICELVFEGSENSQDISFENAYRQWRNAQSNAVAGYSSYVFANISSGEFTQASNENAKITDILNDASLFVGYRSLPGGTGGEAGQASKAFISDGSTETLLLGPYTAKGGFSAAYKIKKVGGKTYVIGSVGVSLPKNGDYYQYCYNTEELDSRYNYNDLTYCPGFDTQPYYWEISGTTITKQGYLTNNQNKWLGDREEQPLTASALDINKAGVAVGFSSFSDYDGDHGGRTRAISMTPDAQGKYTLDPKRLELTTSNISKDKDEYIYNTWGFYISDKKSLSGNYVVVGNSESNITKRRNKPVEFFITDDKNSAIVFPLKDKRVLSTKQRNDGTSESRDSMNSRAFDATTVAPDQTWVVGEADDYDQIHPVYEGTPRSQTAFLYDSKSNKSWRISDLICEKKGGVVTCPLYRLRSARVISDDASILLVEGFKYPTADAYKNRDSATPVTLKLTRTTVKSPNDAPNAWDSELLKDEDESYSREGGSAFWLLLLSLPLLIVRRRKHK